MACHDWLRRFPRQGRVAKNFIQIFFVAYGKDAADADLGGIAKKDLASLKKEIDYVALCKLAIEQADGVILQSPNINQELVEYTKSLGKPVLEYQAPEAYADACSDFYNMVMESNNEETNE